MCWFFLWGFCGCWCATTACTQHGCSSIYWLSLCSRQGGSHTLSDICNATIVQWRYGGGVLTLDCRGYGTPSLREIPLASWYRNASLSRQKLKISQRPTLLLIMTISKTSNILYNWSPVRVRALGTYSLMWMFDIKNVRIISSACTRNGRQGRLLLKWPGRDSTKKGAAVLTILHQQKIFPSGRNGCIRVATLRHSHHRHTGGGLLRARHQYHASHCLSPSDRGVMSPHVLSKLSSSSVGTRWEDMILPGYDDPHNCVNPRNIGNSLWVQKLG